MVLVVFRHKSVKPDDEWCSLQEKLYVNQNTNVSLSIVFVLKDSTLRRTFFFFFNQFHITDFLNK